ncbi:hypothetical protein FE257_005588 [Aspergillus nanangensis]|uniref:Uncharacterized protein n=1 Tax=Aspergillus nanangensis TaxID=2582783 RepID=A0AAD4CQQ3_ASPNN|nr:hypothetical protein FE257_005588 [Aspergillus nanangensis]
MAAITPERARQIVEEVFRRNGGINQDERDAAPKPVTQALDNLRQQLTNSAILPLSAFSKTDFVTQMIANTEDLSYQDREPCCTLTVLSDRICIDINDNGCQEDDFRNLFQPTGERLIKKGLNPNALRSAFRVARQPLNDMATRIILWPAKFETFDELAEEIRTIANNGLLLFPEHQSQPVSCRVIFKIRPTGKDPTHIEYKFESRDNLVKVVRASAGCASTERRYFVFPPRPKPSSPNPNMLAFPIDEHFRPLVRGHEQVYVKSGRFGFPKGHAKFNFAICTPNINEPILQTACDIFSDAARFFSQNPSMKYHWVQYIPEQEANRPSWQNLPPLIYERLRSLPVFWTQNGNQKRLLDLGYLTYEHCDQNAEPLFKDSSDDLYLSTQYNGLLRWLKPLGPRVIPNSYLLERFEQYLTSLFPKIQFYPTKSDWHERASRLLVSWLKIDPTSNLATKFKALPLIHLSDGSMISGTNLSQGVDISSQKKAVYFYTDTHAVLDTSGKGSPICQDTCLFKTYRNDIYLETGGPYGTKAIAEKLSQDTNSDERLRILHSCYRRPRLAFQVDKSDTWETWLKEKGVVHQVPRLTLPSDPKQLSGLFKSLIACCQNDLLGILKTYWDSYKTKMTPPVISTIGEAIVPVVDGVARLSECYFPVPEHRALVAALPATFHIPFLKLPDTLAPYSQEDWNFLRLEYADCGDYINELRYRSDEEKVSLEEVRQVYSAILQNAEEADEWRSLRNLFQETKLIYDPRTKSWYSSGSCVWAASSIGQKIGISESYPGMKSFFVDSLQIPLPSISTYVELIICLCAKESTAVEKIIDAMRHINNLQPTESDLEPLRQIKFLPVAGESEDFHLVSPESDFFIIDREGWPVLFYGRLQILHLNVQEVRELTAFLSCLGLKSRFVSTAAIKETCVSPRPTERSTNLTEDFHQKAMALSRCAVYFHQKNQENRQQDIYETFQKASVYESENITGKCYLVSQSGLRVYADTHSRLHMEYASGKLQIFIPSDPKERSICYSTQLPDALIASLGIQDPAAHGTFATVLRATDSDEADEILKEHGVPDVLDQRLTNPKSPDRRETDHRDAVGDIFRPVALITWRDDEASLKAPPRRELQLILRPKDIDSSEVASGSQMQLVLAKS